MSGLFQCVIIAGGLGTRMRHRTGLSPKALLPVRGRAFLEWQLELLRKQGIERVLISAGFGGDQLRAWLQERELGLRVEVVQEPEPLLGTAGAVRYCIAQGMVEPQFFTIYGDSYLTVPFASVQAAFERAGEPALMTVFQNDGKFDRSNVWFENGRIRLYTKTPSAAEAPQLTAIDYGLLVLDRDWFSARVPEGEKRDLSQVLNPLSREGHLAGFEVAERFYEVGSEPGLQDFERFLEEKGPL